MTIQWGHWISMDMRSEPVRKNVRGTEVLTLPSPYDIPEAVRAGFDFTANQMLVQFKYIEQDAPVERIIDQLTRLLIGRHSGRLLGVSIDVDGFPKDSAVARAADNLKRALRVARPTRPEREVNFRLAQEGFERAESRVVESLTSAGSL